MLEKNYLIEMKRYIFSREVAFCKGMQPIEKEYYFCLQNATTFE